MAVRRFEELYGVDLPKFLNKVIAENKDPIEEMVVLINQLTGGDVFAVSEIFRNKTPIPILHINNSSVSFILEASFAGYKTLGSHFIFGFSVSHFPLA